MTATELIKNIDKIVIYHGNGYYDNDGQSLSFEATIVDAKTAYGRVLYKIRPVAGFGSTWVAESSISIKSGESL